MIFLNTADLGSLIVYPHLLAAEVRARWNVLHHRSAIIDVEMSQLELGAKLGDGASGDVFAATLNGGAVALKARCCGSLHVFNLYGSSSLLLLLCTEIPSSRCFALLNIEFETSEVHCMWGFTHLGFMAEALAAARGTRTLAPGVDFVALT